ncbi:transcription factor bHLH103-like isoform X1 [Papaver somniferum]|uniref:transcription factor bHLH103-like isoform X1 n=1 Tax=Papaver somniferum TaxID=3469 RepID=UPI000E7051EC|nr:transcription factor bHLH103-like isoform X1 [Papaver somniferum]XP_026411787.1 transcription factor bHLH103-like isoform X1 [Papaver somniferum]
MRSINVHPHNSGGNNYEMEMPNPDEENVILNSFRGCMPCTTLEELSRRLLVNKQTVYMWCDHYRSRLLSLLEIREDACDKPNLFKPLDKKMSEIMVFKPNYHVRDTGFAPLPAPRLLPLLSKASVTYIIKELNNIHKKERKRPVRSFNPVRGESSKKKKKVPPVAENSSVDERLSDGNRGKQPMSEEQNLARKQVQNQIHDLEKSQTLEDISTLDDLINPSSDTDEEQVLNEIHDLEESLIVEDKISTLHDLINPFGLTGEAEVLEDARDYIRYLHNQIEMMYTWRYYHLKNDVQVATGEIRNGLTERELCLVPVSFTHNINLQDKP